MADTNPTLEQPVQPTQELTALERAKAADTRKTEILSAEQAYDELELFGTEPGEYGESSPVQGVYWRFKFRGAIVTVSPEFKEAYDNGGLLGITATPTVFEQDKADPNNAGKTRKVVGYGWSLGFSDLAKKQKAQKARMAMHELNLTSQLQEIKMEKKIEAVKAANFKVVIDDAEIQKMLDKV